jgi:hypothetical protein
MLWWNVFENKPAKMLKTNERKSWKFCSNDDKFSMA